MIPRRLRFIVATLLLYVSYMAVIMEWVWILVVALPPLIKKGAFDWVTTQSPSAPVVNSQPIAASPIVWMIIGIITLIVLAITVVVLIKLPKTIVQTSDKVFHQAADAVIPVVTHHKPLSNKKRLVLSRRLTLLFQVLATIFPVVACLFVPPLHELPRQIVVTVTLLLGVVSLIGFCASWLLMPLATSRTQSPASRE